MRPAFCVADFSAAASIAMLNCDTRSSGSSSASVKHWMKLGESGEATYETQPFVSRSSLGSKVLKKSERNLPLLVG